MKNRRKLFSDVPNRIQRDLDMRIPDKMSVALLKISKKKNAPNYYSVKENEKFRSKHWYPKNIVGPDIIQMFIWRPSKSEMRCQKYLEDPIRLFYLTGLFKYLNLNVPIFKGIRKYWWSRKRLFRHSSIKFIFDTFLFRLKITWNRRYLISKIF